MRILRGLEVIATLLCPRRLVARDLTACIENPENHRTH
jgi:hypothetical protein